MESWKADEQHSSRVVKSAERRCDSVKVRRKKIHPRQILEKSRNAVFFPMVRALGQSKSRPVKAAGAEVSGPRRNQKLHAAVAKSIFSSENAQNTSCSEHFSSDVEKLHAAIAKSVEKWHAAVARSTFWSENVQNTYVFAHFLKFTCRKISQLASSSVNQSVR